MTARAPVSALEPQVQVNEAFWANEDLVRHYEDRVLRAAEVMLLVRYREALAGRVLELGCGGGRLSGYLVELAQEFHGVDISPKMVAHCRRIYPGAVFEVRDLRDLSDYPSGHFDVVLAPFNVLDVLDEKERRRVISDIHVILADGGLLIMSSHNLAHAPFIPKPTAVRSSPLRGAVDLLRMPRRVLNHRRLRARQHYEEGYAILIDEAHEFAILHYYVSRDVQERQLAELGFELLACLDLDGRQLSPGGQAEHVSELHYVARRSQTRAADTQQASR